MVSNMFAKLKERFGNFTGIISHGDEVKSFNRNEMISEAGYVVIDTELTGLDEKKDSILSMGGVKMTGSMIKLGGHFYMEVKPESVIDTRSVVIHQITPSDVKEKPFIESVLMSFLDFIGDRIIVGHCISIDIAFMKRYLRKMSINLENPVIDTLSLYTWLKRRNLLKNECHNPVNNYSLYDIVKCFGITAKNAHHALSDAFVTAQLFQRLLLIFQNAGIKFTGELLRIGDPAKGGDPFIHTCDIQNL